MTLKRRTPLKRTALKRTGFKQKRRTSKSDFDADTRAIIMRRSAGRCEAHTAVCQQIARHIHHILRRSQGGMGTVDNGLHVCTACHTWIHDHPLQAELNGWLRRSHAG